MKARTLGLGAVAIGLAAAAGGAIYIEQQRPLMELATGYSARVACGCRYVGNRPLEMCYKDFDAGLEAIWLSENPVQKSVTASVPLIARRTVRYTEALGCQPEPFRGTPHKVR